jgi:1-deoxy-D-xylulose-5-phosphate synthase
VDGHDIAAMDAAFDRALHGPLPCVVHVRTQKGYGWQSALDDEEKRLHDVGPGHPPRPGPVPSWSSVIGDLLCEAAENDPRVHAITAAMPGTLGLTGFAARFPERYHDLGIAEQACVAAAAGLASQGMRPFFAVVATFLTRALDQVLYDVALHRLPVVFLLDRAGVTGPDGPSHHGAFDVGMLRNVPGIEIYSPWTVDDVRKVLREALSRDHGPIVIRYPKGRPAPAEQGARVGRQLLREGRDACLVAHGHTVTATLEAARILSDRDRLNCSVWRLSRIHPLDPAMVRYVADQRLVIPVEDVGAAGGLAGPLALELSRWPVRPARIEPLTLPAGFLPHGTREELLTEYGLTPGGIADAVRETLRREPWPGPRPG